MKRENGFGLTPADKILWRELKSKGYDNAINVAQSLHKTQAIEFVAADINRWGCSLIEQEKLRPALDVFLLNNPMFPNSANTCDSLAETYWLLGNIEGAISGYEIVLKMQPDNDYAASQLAKLRSL